MIGTVIAAPGNLQLGSHSGASAYVLIDLMSSCGSSFWNHALDAMRAMKIDKEAEAYEKVALSREVVAKVAAAGAGERP